MTGTDRRRLAAILGMLGSGFEGEQASAARQAEAFRKRHGLTWEQMLSLPPLREETTPASAWARPWEHWEQQPPQPAPPPPEPPPAPRRACYDFVRAVAAYVPAQAVAALYVVGLIGGAVLINIYL
jgi:hypothetical protein